MSARRATANRSPAASTVKLTNVEKVALERSGYDLIYPPDEKVPSIIVPNFPALGKLTAARFLEWVLENPEGVISLPTGKTPEHFIKYVQHFLRTWDRRRPSRHWSDDGPRHRPESPSLPGCASCRSTSSTRSTPSSTTASTTTYHKYYIRGFGLDPDARAVHQPQQDRHPVRQEAARTSFRT